MAPSALPERDLLEEVRCFFAVPSLRLDLRFVRNNDSKLFRLCDPRSQQFLELYELECLVVQALDGVRTVDDLTALAQTYNAEIKRDQIEQLLVQLLALGLLDQGRDVTKPGHGKVIPLPVAHADEFAAFRNEVVLDLQRQEALKWADVEVPKRTPFFSASSSEDLLDNTNLTGSDDVELEDTNLRSGTDPFATLERSRARLVTAGDVEDEPVFSSAARITPTERGAAVARQAPAPEPAEPEERNEEPAQPATPQSAASEQEKLWVDSQSQKVRWYKRTSVRFLIVLVALVTASMFIHYPLYVTSPCSITPAEHIYVRASIAGVLAEILVDEGMTVKKGDVIARLDDRDLSADKRKALAEVERIEADLQKLQHGARPEEISQQRAILRARQTAVSFANKEATRRARMLKEGVGSRQSLEEAQLDLQVKQNAAAEAAAALQLVQAGTRVEEVTAQEAALRRAKAELDFIQQKLSDMVVIRAPIDGVILTPKFRERLQESVQAGGLVCEIANIRTVRAEVFVPEREADTVAVGMPVVVKVESFPMHPFKGTVDFIAPAVEIRDNQNVVRIVAKLDNQEGLLRQNMTGYGEVECGDRSLFDLATRRLLRWIRVRFLI